MTASERNQCITIVSVILRREWLLYANDRLAAACVYPRVHGSMRLSAVAGYPMGVVRRKPTRKNQRKLFRHSVLRSLIKIRGISGANGIPGPGPVHRNAISSNYLRDKPPLSVLVER